MDNEIVNYLIKELENKTENETKLVKAICGVIKDLIIFFTISTIVIAISYFWSPQDYSENNTDSKNIEFGGY